MPGFSSPPTAWEIFLFFNLPNVSFLLAIAFICAYDAATNRKSEEEVLREIARGAPPSTRGSNR